MAGLGQQPGGMQQQQPPAQQQQPAQGQTPPGMDDSEVLEQATPEEQKQFDTFVGLALLALYDEEMLPETVKLIQEAPSPQQGVATVAASLAVRVYTAAQEDGVNLVGDVLLHGGAEIVEAVVEVSDEAGLSDFTQEEMQEAYLLSADKFRADMKKLGVYSEEEEAQDIATIEEMKQSGQLDRIMGALAAKTSPHPVPKSQPAPEQTPQAPAPKGLGPQDEEQM